MKENGTFVVGKLVRASALTWCRGALKRTPEGIATNNPHGTCPIGLGASGTSRARQRRAMA